MIDYERVSRTWDTLCNIAEEGDGPWRAMHEYQRGWMAKHKLGREPAIKGLRTRRQAVAISAALNLCLFIEQRTVAKGA